MAALVFASAACGGPGSRDVVAPPVDLLATLPGTYGLTSVDGQPLPIEVNRTAVGADTLVADTILIRGTIDSSLGRTRVVRWYTSGGIGAGSHTATFGEYGGGWRVRGGKAYVWAGDDSVPMSVPDAATVAFTRAGRMYVYKR